MTAAGVCAAYCIACLVVSAALCVWSAAFGLSQRLERRCERAFAHRYMNMITARMLDGDSVPMARFPMCGRRGARAVLARTLATASASTCCDGICALRRMVAANGIEGWLLHRVRRSGGYVRARYLAMLSALPISCTTAAYVQRYAASKNPHIRFRTLLTAIAADPSSSVRMLAAYPSALTPFEMAELTAVLRRGLLPLACDPLLLSPGLNLRMLGLNIVKVFGVTETEHLLLDLMARDDAAGLHGRIVDVLVSLHLPVGRRAVAAYVRSMRASERRMLFRRMASEGYSAEAIMRLADRGETAYVESIVASYKRSLVCCQ